MWIHAVASLGSESHSEDPHPLPCVVLLGLETWRPPGVMPPGPRPSGYLGHGGGEGEFTT